MDDDSLNLLRQKLHVLCQKMQVCENAMNNINSATKHLPNQAQWFNAAAKSDTLVFLQAAKLFMQKLDTRDIIESIAETERAFEEAQVYVHKKRAEPVHATEETGVESRPETETEGYKVLRSWSDIEQNEGNESYEYYQDRMYKPTDPNGHFQRWKEVNGKYKYERAFSPNTEYLKRYLPQTAPRQNDTNRPDFTHHATTQTLLNRMQELGC
jgi:hypothetical protein